MSRFLVLAFCLLWPTTVSAGQASAQFNVGIIITGKRASSAPRPNENATRPAPDLKTSAFARAVGSKRPKSCFGYRSFDAATGTYVGLDGNVHRCR